MSPRNSTLLPLLVAPPARSGPGRAWRRVRGGLARAARQVREAAVSAYRAVDPDLRRHLAQSPLVGLTMLGPRRKEVRPLPDDGHRVVIFVHGLGGRRGNFLPMATGFRLAGRRRTYSVSFPPGMDFERMPAHLTAFIERVAHVNGLGDDARVDLVAHSMGGVIARLALDHPRTARRVATLVTLATPHGGTHVARYAATSHTLALRPGSVTVKRLEAQLPWRGPTRLVSFWSRADMLLLPAETAVVAGAESRELPGMTHYAWLMRPACWFRVLAELAPRA